MKRKFRLRIYCKMYTLLSLYYITNTADRNDIKAMPPRPDNKTDEEIAVAEVYRLIDAPNATRPCDRNLNFPVLIDIVTNFFNTPDYCGPVMIEELALAFLQGWHMNHTYNMAAWKKEHREMLTNGLYNYRERLLADE